MLSLLARVLVNREPILSKLKILLEVLLWL